MVDPVMPSPDERTDEQLMLESARGDRDAFGEIVSRHHQRALDLAYRLCGDGELARDAAQESFLRILRSAHRYEARARFSTYLFTVVRNTVRELCRRQRRRRELPLEGSTEGADDVTTPALAETLPGPPAPDALLEDRELGRRLVAALRALPEGLRAVFVLSELEGLRYREIAGICGCPIGTVASRKHAAIAALRRTLGPLRGDL